jgi:hypothetical protein
VVQDAVTPFRALDEVAGDDEDVPVRHVSYAVS